MFKIRAIGLVGILGALLTLAGIVGLNRAEEAARDHALKRVSGTRSALARAFQAREARQALVATMLADSELTAALAALADFRKDLERAQTETYQKAPGTDARAVEAREALIREVRVEGVSLPDAFATRFANHLGRCVGPGAFQPRGLDAFLRDEADRFAKCAAFGGVDQCLWDYTYNTLPKVLSAIARTRRVLVDQRVFVVGPDGVGLADSGNPQWSRAEGFASKTRLPFEALRTRGPVQGLALVENRYYFGTAVPLLQEGRLVGAILVGDPIDERMAREDSDIVGADVMYVMGGKVIAAPLAADLAARLVSEPRLVPERVTASFRALDDESSPDLRVVVSQDLGALVAAFGSARTTVFLIGLLVTLLAVGLLTWFMRSFYQSFEVLDQGVHEVINGNLEYQFPFEFKEDLARGLGQSLNLMSLVLQGRPLPEEVEEQETGKTSWTGELQVLDAAESEPEWGETSRPTVAFDFEAARTLAEEPADVYYKRIYSEFLEARRSLGLPTEGINYPKFLERLVHLEQGLKKKHRSSMVRFTVKTRNGAVVLDPVPIRKLPR